MIYANFESILVPQDNGRQNPNEPYTNKYQRHVTCTYGYKFENFENSAKCWICYNSYFDGDVKVSLSYQWKIQKFCT